MSQINGTARRAIAVAGIAAVLGFAACSENPLAVETASRIPAENVETPANAQLLVDGAIADFECAFAAYVVQSATVGEEFIYAQQTADRTPVDRRTTLPTDLRYGTFGCTALGVYAPVQTARASAERILTYLKSWTDAEVANRTRLISLAAAYAGYSYVLLGEAFCTIAISTVNPDRSIDYGGEISRDSTFTIAVARFTEAIAAAQASGNTEILRMAYLGRARAKLNLGDWAGARADAQEIPSGYVKDATYSDAVPRRRNLVFLDNAATSQASSIGEPYRSMNDPRVPVVQGTGTSATGINHWYQTKYISNASPIPLATYEEAQLIIAESYIRENALALALPILQESRARGDQDLFVGITQNDYMAELVDQRRRELFLEGHHIGDVLRYDIPVQPATGTAYHFSGSYGSQICFPLPERERLNNPMIP